MAQQEQSAKFSVFDFKAVVNAGTFVSQTLAVLANVVIHSAPGERYIGLPGLILIPAMTAYAAFTSNFGGPLVALMIPYYITVCLVWFFYAKYRRVRLRRLVHTRYSGRPWILFLFPRWHERWVKKAEPIVVMLLGLALMPLNRAFGGLVFLAGLGAGMSNAIQAELELKKKLDQADAMLEQQALAANARELSGQL